MHLDRSSATLPSLPVMEGSVDMNMGKAKVIYKEESVLFARYFHPKSEDFLEYKAKIAITGSGKTPIQMDLKFDGILPSVAPMPPREYSIKAKSILDLSVKVKRWLKKYGYELI